MAKLGITLSFALVVLLVANGRAQEQAALKEVDRQRATNVELIDELATAKDFGVGFHPTAWD